MKDEEITVEKLLNELIGMSHTIVELKASVAKYQMEVQALNQYKIVVENIRQKIFIKDKNLAYVFCNANYARDLKMKPEEICGKTDYDFFPPEVAERLVISEKRILATGEEKDFTERYIQEGQEKLVHKKKTLLKDEKGNTLGILGIEEEESIEYQARPRELLLEPNAEPRKIPPEGPHEDTKGQSTEEFRHKREEHETVQRITQEIAMLANRGQILRERLNLEEMCERFRAKVSKLVKFDGITIAVPDLQGNTATLVYAAGMGLATRRVGDKFSLSKTGEEEVIKIRSSLLLQKDHPEEVLRRFEIFLPYYRSGFHSLFLAPLLDKNAVVGVLTFLATRQNAYSEEDLRLAESAGIWLAPALAGLRQRTEF